MEKEEADAVFGHDLEPIEHYLDLLRDPDAYEPHALGMCLVRFEEAAPALRAVLAKAADAQELSDAEWSLFVNGIHILGAARDPASFQPLLRFLRLPGDDVEFLIGDVITDSLRRIVAGVFDGNVPALFDAIRDGEIDDFVRSALVDAATYLTWDGRIETDATRSFLASLVDVPTEDDNEIFWFTWAQSIALLGLRDLEPLVAKAYAEERLTDLYMKESDFEADLAAAERAPRDKERLERAYLGYIEDIGKEEILMRGRDGDGADGSDWGPAPQLVINPYRNVGRNDPCPCGSGKKAKKCCLASA